MESYITFKGPHVPQTKKCQRAIILEARYILPALARHHFTRFLKTMKGVYHFHCYNFKSFFLFLNISIISSDEIGALGFTTIVDMRGNATWNSVKPILKVLQEYFAAHIHTAHIIKPNNFFQKTRTR